MKNSKISLEKLSQLLTYYQNTKDEETLELLLISFTNLIYYFAYRYKKAELEFDDLTSLGKIGLINAFKKFDLNRYIEAFPTYASISIKNEILGELRKLNDALGLLTDTEKKIITLRYGLEDGLEKKLCEIADIVGCTKSYISRLERKALEKINNKFAK